jgi:hypothetical protein
MYQFTLRSLWAEPNHVVWTNIEHSRGRVTHRASHPVYLAETPLKIGTFFVALNSTSRHSSRTSSCNRPFLSTRWNVSSDMLKRAFVSFVASSIFLKVAAGRDPFLIVYMKEGAFFSLLALILHPVNTNSSLSLALVYLLLL